MSVHLYTTMEGNETVLAALYFLLDPDLACKSFLNGKFINYKVYDMNVFLVQILNTKQTKNK